MNQGNKFIAVFPLQQQLLCLDRQHRRHGRGQQRRRGTAPLRRTGRGRGPRCRGVSCRIWRGGGCRGGCWRCPGGEHAIDGEAIVISNQERAVGQAQQAHRPPPVLVLRSQPPAGSGKVAIYFLEGRVADGKEQGGCSSSGVSQLPGEGILAERVWHQPGRELRGRGMRSAHKQRSTAIEKKLTRLQTPCGL